MQRVQRVDKVRRVLRLSTLMICLAGLGAHAQQATTVPGTSATTRAQVKIERDEFIKSHRWDPVIDDWALKPGYEPPVGMKDRAQIKEERNGGCQDFCV